MSINVLPMNLRNKIAAGEVVERPASVVKELIENSMDAGSSRIDIDILKAGKRLIRVSDNGIGMDRKDALLSLERYTTSKIKDEDDLFNIKTMGFRGEALSSIASVSRMRLTTAQRSDARAPGSEETNENNNIGTCIEMAGGGNIELRDCMSIGTSVEIKDLFFNTPARRKFLKSDSTENYHIIDIVTRGAISRYDIGFVLRIDDSETMNLPAASSRRERLLQIFGKDFVDGLMTSESDDEQMGISIFCGNNSNFRNNRNNQFVFINNRPVRDQTISYAVFKAYEGLIPKDKHPVFLIFLEMNPQKVDFNVHPAKREVRFEDKSRVYNFVYKSARAALKNAEEAAYAAGEEASMNHQWTGMSLPAHSAYNHPDAVMCGQQAVSEASPFYDLYSGTESMPFIYLGETFVAMPDKKGLVLMDYHAAHERINYERLLTGSEDGSGHGSKVASYRLLFPQQVKLQAGEYMIVLENLKYLNELGVEVADFGHGAVIVRSLPDFLRDADLNALISDIAASLLNSDVRLKQEKALESVESIDSKKKTIAAKLACHSSIRGREIPDGVRAAALIKDIEKTENPDACPHGRPTRIFISMAELKKMFKK